MLLHYIMLMWGIVVYLVWLLSLVELPTYIWTFVAFSIIYAIINLCEQMLRGSKYDY